MAHVEAVCTSEKKGQVKRERAHVLLKTEWGMENDAHAGNWHRQISLLAGESIDNVKEILPSLEHGAFAENIIIRGIDLTSVKIGDRLRIADQVILEITQIGKKCHNDVCVIKKATGDCIMPRDGLFARVIRGGEVRAGDPLTVDSPPHP